MLKNNLKNRSIYRASFTVITAYLKILLLSTRDVLNTSTHNKCIRCKDKQVFVTPSENFIFVYSLIDILNTADYASVNEKFVSYNTLSAQSKVYVNSCCNAILETKEY